MVRRKRRKKPYTKRSDEEKVRINWNKTMGLLERKEYSVSILRAHTTIELAANFVIRVELVNNRNLPTTFVDNLMVGANGLNGKIHNIILPILKETDKYETFRSLRKDIQTISTQRNRIAHSGEFKRRSTAEKMIKIAHQVICSMVAEYEPDFELDLRYLSSS